MSNHAIQVLPFTDDTCSDSASETNFTRISFARISLARISRARISLARISLARISLALAATFLIHAAVFASAASAADKESFAERTAKMERSDGFLPFFWEETSGKIWFEITRLGEEFIYFDVLETGLGSNPVGLDRGQLGAERIVRFERVGPKVLLVEPNQDYRALSEDAAERVAVEESFARSVLWAGEIAAEENGRLLVDASSFLFRDVHDVAGSLKDADQGSFQLDKDRSYVYRPRTKAFPQNTEISVELTFGGSDPGRYVRETAPDPTSVTLRVRHSFVQLPPDGYEPRAFDPRIGGFHIAFHDYASELDRPLTQRWIQRHRLEKTDPTAPSSPVIEPIVYYVDPGAPEPVRSALVEGASWWNEAFEAAGFENAFRVEVLPEDADPLDIRYNVIQWVHRSTRGWSYGSQVIDPRTGEILKAKVSLGSLRVRQDRLIFEGLFGRGPQTVELALARIRQLSAHEVGHTLGFAHNFAASTNGRASVMDYPAPWIRLKDGELDATDAYDVGIGEWDKFTTRFAYSQFAEGADEGAELKRIADEARAAGLEYMSDADARGSGAGHPNAALWDNGNDPIAALEEIMDVRALALDRFDTSSLSADQPTALLEEILVPIYLLHRFQIDAAVKSVGGAFYEYELSGEARSGRRPVRRDRQMDALNALLDVLRPEALRMPDQLLTEIPPHPYGYFDSRERFPRNTGKYLDPLASARVVCDQVVTSLLQRERAARLEQQTLIHPDLPGFRDVVARLVAFAWEEDIPKDPYSRGLVRTLRDAVVDGLTGLSGDGRAEPTVRALADEALRYIVSESERNRGADPQMKAHADRVRDDVERFLERPHAVATSPTPVTPPPGSPIGNSIGNPNAFEARPSAFGPAGGSCDCHEMPAGFGW